MKNVEEVREYLAENIRLRQDGVEWADAILSSFTAPRQVGPEYVALREEKIRRQAGLDAVRAIAMKIG